MHHRNGWLPDLPDHRDAPSLVLRGTRKRGKGNPTRVDLRKHCSPIEDQVTIGSCTSHAVIGLLEHLQRREHGKHIDASRLFLYKVTRKLLGWRGDTGAHLRTTIKALVCFGVPPESHYPYKPENFEQEPDAFVYALAQNFKALRYFRVDRRGQTANDTLGEIKRVLSEGHPLAFGFTTFDNLGGEADIEFPSKVHRPDGGHAVMAIGYDDERKIGSHQGAVLIRNSWGTTWGDKGYGWLPYQFVLEGLTEDWWALVDANHIDLAAFE